MDRELEVIRDDMEQTRANLADKLGALESQVRQTVSSTSEAVSSTVEGVKEVVSNVSDTVDSVTETFNISKHIEQNPLLAVGIALGTGFVIGQLLGGSREEPSHHHHQAFGAPPPSPPQPAPPPQQPREEPSSMLSGLESMMPDMGGVVNTAVSGLGGLAIGSVMGVIRELAVSALPAEWKGELNKLVDQVTNDLGGKPIQARREESKPQEATQPAQGAPGGSTPENAGGNATRQPDRNRGRREPAGV